MRTGTAGSAESSDILITVRASDVLSVSVRSSVYEYFGKSIEKTVREVLRERGADRVEVICEDRGALDGTIRARLKTALDRMEGRE